MEEGTRVVKEGIRAVVLLTKAKAEPIAAVAVDTLTLHHRLQVSYNISKLKIHHTPSAKNNYLFTINVCLILGGHTSYSSHSGNGFSASERRENTRRRRQDQVSYSD